MSANNPTVVVVGGSYVDIAVRCETIPPPGKSVAGSDLSYTPTGPGINQAIQAALCGCDVHLITKTGNDPFGKLILEELNQKHVNTDFICRAEAKTTGTIVTLVNHEGENAGVVSPGANCALTEADIAAAEEIFDHADVCLMHGSLPMEAVERAVRLAKFKGVKTILNPAGPINKFGEMSTALPMDFFSTDMLIPNLYEAAQITEHCAGNIRTAKSIGSELVGLGVKTAIITMGKRGCMVVDRNGADHIPAFPIELVDQTGTGDAFAGALAACSAVSDDIRECVKFASAAGALACTKFGAAESLATRADIIELLQIEDMGPSQ